MRPNRPRVKHLMPKKIAKSFFGPPFGKYRQKRAEEPQRQPHIPQTPKPAGGDTSPSQQTPQPILPSTPPTPQNESPPPASYQPPSTQNIEHEIESYNAQQEAPKAEGTETPLGFDTELLDKLGASKPEKIPEAPKSKLEYLWFEAGSFYRRMMLENAGIQPTDELIKTKWENLSEEMQDKITKANSSESDGGGQEASAEEENAIEIPKAGWLSYFKDYDWDLMPKPESEETQDDYVNAFVKAALGRVADWELNDKETAEVEKEAKEYASEKWEEYMSESPKEEMAEDEEEPDFLAPSDSFLESEEWYPGKDDESEFAVEEEPEEEEDTSNDKGTEEEIEGYPSVATPEVIQWVEQTVRDLNDPSMFKTRTEWDKYVDRKIVDALQDEDLADSSFASLVRRAALDWAYEQWKNRRKD